ncbi:hypothetical protein ACFPYJ_10110 [Paenibacillus solisilvae]|uniref:Uncharacterized protein n=1 Tax=Paenibacillus solisilvae TaxID=2486751 RepID=A0ABW0VXI5_9BACL
MTTRYNPFEDKTLHYLQPQEQVIAGEDRTPFNDVIRHADIVQGYQAPKQLDQFARWFQNSQRIYATISVLGIAVFLGYEIVKIIISLTSDK